MAPGLPRCGEPRDRGGEIGRDDADRLMALLARMEEMLDDCPPAVQAETIRRFRMD
ncbi:hypothetical protein [Methanoculleus chikugoensis]|uniref:hypothetical protein n=1 Tax=Methanoculleus chikugoensis TaxID=118126 RepID=UPI000A4AEF9D|nr:hypothetical protein [Methanoculleus chikugoensis]